MSKQVVKYKDLIGVGLRQPHYKDFIEGTPDIGWLEVHSENFFAEGGASIEFLHKIANKYPLSMHGVGLSLGSSDGLDKHHLTKLKKLISEVKPFLVSEHVSWSGFGGQFLNDLLPLPYNQESLEIICDNINYLQDFLGREILIENPSSYMAFDESSMSEWEFMRRAQEKTNCGLLLDLNNIFVSAYNHNFSSIDYIDHMPIKAVKEIHLAGPTKKQLKNKEIFIDSHSTKVMAEVWQLYEYATGIFGAVPTLIEWDNNIPELSILLGEAEKARKIIRTHDGS